MKKPYYEEAGVRYPTVTRILSILREPDIDPAILEDAAKLGTTGHKMIEADLKQGKWSVPENPSHELMQVVAAYNQWKREHEDFLASEVEEPHISASLGYGGTPDSLDLDSLIITEWKFTSQIRAKHWLQTNALIPLCFPQHLWLKVRRRIVRFDKHLGVYEQPLLRLFSLSEFETFMKLKDVYMAWFAHEMGEKEEAWHSPS